VLRAAGHLARQARCRRGDLVVDAGCAERRTIPAGRVPYERNIEMDEIIQRLIEKTGLPADKARAAVDTVLGFLKERLPGPMASQIDNLLAGGSTLGDKLGSAAKGLGGMFSKKE
jgi:hypothetical protein